MAPSIGVIVSLQLVVCTSLFQFSDALLICPTGAFVRSLSKTSQTNCFQNRKLSLDSPSRKMIQLFNKNLLDDNSDVTNSHNEVQIDNSTRIQHSGLITQEEEDIDSVDNKRFLHQIFESIIKKREANFPVPIQIQDVNVLYYDLFLIVNLSVSISFWVVHRLSFVNAVEAFSEGSLLGMLWIASGLYYGAFLFSAVDGHYDMSKEENFSKGGPKAAGLLGLWTFVGTINLRMLVALLTAFAQHRPVGVSHGEELIPLELCFGLILMSMWRMLHSTYSRV